MHALFDQFADRYDWHTPPGHYKHDHELVLQLAREQSATCRLLDIGCGTGVLLEKAKEAGIEATGIDASPGMVRVARRRVGADFVSLGRMQDISDRASFDLIVALSWTINYCESVHDLRGVLRRMHDALRPRGRVLLQVAHAAHVDGEPMEDRERGPQGQEDDVVLRYRFVALEPSGLEMRADYAYACKSLNEEFSEAHALHVTDARVVAECVAGSGFTDVEIYDSWRRDAFAKSAIPFVTAVRGAGP